MGDYVNSRGVGRVFTPDQLDQEELRRRSHRLRAREADRRRAAERVVVAARNVKDHREFDPRKLTSASAPVVNTLLVAALDELDDAVAAYDNITAGRLLCQECDTDIGHADDRTDAACPACGRVLCTRCYQQAHEHRPYEGAASVTCLPTRKPDNAPPPAYDPNDDICF